MRDKRRRKKNQTRKSSNPGSYLTHEKGLSEKDWAAILTDFNLDLTKSFQWNTPDKDCLSDESGIGQK